MKDIRASALSSLRSLALGEESCHVLKIFKQPYGTYYKELRSTPNSQQQHISYVSKPFWKQIHQPQSFSNCIPGQHLDLNM